MTADPPALASTDSSTAVRRLTFFFGLAYLSQGFSQDAAGIVAQPLRDYFLHGLHWPVDRMSALLSVLIIPWLVKPVYGLITDLVPIARRHRRPYLLLTNALAAAGFLAASGIEEPHALVAALLLTSVGVAFADVVTDALMVSEGQKWRCVPRFQGVQWTWINIAGVAAAVIGGYLAASFGPRGGLAAACLLTVLAPVGLFVASWLVVREEPRPARSSLREAVEPLLDGFRTRELWLAAVFLLFWNCTPSFGDPLYAHMSDRLKFGQDLIGNLGAVSSLGMALGAWWFERHLARRFSTRTIVLWSIPVGAASTLLFLAMKDPVSAGVIHFVTGAVGMIATLVVLGLAGVACPPKGAGFWFAALMSVSNGSSRISIVGGSILYERVLQRDLAPLIWISAGTTLLLYALVPLVNRIVHEAAPAEPPDRT